MSKKEELTHEELIKLSILETLEDVGEELDKDKKDGLIMLYIQIDNE